jgi:uncharacterized flavoprotein (TIGR03862 family)
MAAEVAANGGAKVTLYEGKPSVGRKFLVAGHGGLNLTHSERVDQFAKRYIGSFRTDYWKELFKDFSNSDTRNWAAGLGIDTFIGTSGRVFPKEFKAAPLLRRWVEHLRSLGVVFKTRHYLTKIRPINKCFILTITTPDGVIESEFDALILALGGASWPNTGSTGSWVPHLESHGISINPFKASNCGWEVNWHDYFQGETILSEIEGLPLKNIAVTAADQSIQGELLITQYGLEGGTLYQLASVLRGIESPEISIDLKPSFTEEELAKKINSSSKDLIGDAIRTWRLGPAAAALLRSSAWKIGIINPLSLALLAKNLVIPLSGPRPIAEAISSAGGVSLEDLNEDLMLKNHPGLFVAGEMLDWEVPTGGYLLQGCFATGLRAAQGALKYLSAHNQSVAGSHT